MMLDTTQDHTSMDEHGFFQRGQHRMISAQNLFVSVRKTSGSSHPDQDLKTRLLYFYKTDLYVFVGTS